jgi:hypothetical protein
MGARESEGSGIRAERYQGLRSFHLCRVGAYIGTDVGTHDRRHALRAMGWRWADGPLLTHLSLTGMLLVGARVQRKFFPAMPHLLITVGGGDGQVL